MKKRLLLQAPDTCLSNSVWSGARRVSRSGAMWCIRVRSISNAFNTDGHVCDQRCDGADSRPYRQKHRTDNAKGERDLQEGSPLLVLDGDPADVAFANKALDGLDDPVSGNLELLVEGPATLRIRGARAGVMRFIGGSRVVLTLRRAVCITLLLCVFRLPWLLAAVLVIVSVHVCHSRPRV